MNSHGSKRRGALLDAGGLIFAMTFPTAAAWLYFVRYADAPSMVAVYAACKVLQFSIPLAWVSLAQVQGERPAVPSPRGIRAGALTGLALAGAMWAVYMTLVHGSDLEREASPRIAARIAAMGAASPARFLALSLFVSVAHSFLEEYYWRWFVFGRLRIYRGAAVAGVVSSIAFAGHHAIVLRAFIGPGRFWWLTVLLTLAVALGGGLWAWLYARSRSLLSPWLSHALVDIGIMAIGYHLAGRAP